MADTKNWTWVLERRCPECGFEAGALRRDQIGETTRTVAATFDRFLAEPDVRRPDVRARPAPEVWSTLEYGAHLRDVCRIMGERLRLMLDQDGPDFANWDQDETASTDRYDQQDPATVAADLVVAAAALADAFDAVRPDQWSRIGHRSDGSTFTVESLGRYMVHDLVHHVWDIDQVVSLPPPPPPGPPST